MGTNPKYARNRHQFSGRAISAARANAATAFAPEDLTKTVAQELADVRLHGLSTSQRAGIIAWAVKTAWDEVQNGEPDELGGLDEAQRGFLDELRG